ncbi:hypothetical protein BHE90_000387 [Fusarium euwallaceae]|uniref:SnoaL-like domain-containing protein n=1 Tax=Fusarium euwallaceae TaxID=1147111 RepID=A0A430MAP0_9HYPO|nr:hypothetical protein BHE90_000387 [Fusarium euwallaceae]
MAHVTPEVALAITRQKARYGRYADTKQWDKFAQDIALPDARFSFYDTEGKLLVAGPQSLAFDSVKGCAAFFGKFFSQFQTQHNFGPGDFEQVGPDEVKAIFGMEDQIMSKYLGAWVEIRGGGFYHETWKLVDGEWYLQDLRLERTYQKETVLVKIGLAVAGLFGISL